MVAQKSLLNITQFIGEFGCNLCLVSGKMSSERQVWIYPIESLSLQRTEIQRRENLRKRGNQRGPIEGIKGYICSP